MKLKTCNKCHIEKPTTEFTKAASNKDGRTGACEACNSITRKKYNNKRNLSLSVKGKDYKGYDTYVNADGVTCIKNFNPYGQSRQQVAKAPSVIKERRLPRTFSSDLAI